MTQQNEQIHELNPLLPAETTYIVDAGNIHCKIVVNDLTSVIVSTSYALKKFEGTNIEVLKSWLYRKVSQTYTMKRQGKLGETL